MWERTVTIGSAGKIFGVTGWKIGWAYGHERIMKNLAVVHLNSVFTVPTPLQVFSEMYSKICLFINLYSC